MAGHQRENHFFDATQASGVVVYVIDEDEPVCLKFSNAIRIKVLFDTTDGWSENPKDKDDIYEVCPENMPSHDIVSIRNSTTEKQDKSENVYRYDIERNQFCIIQNKPEESTDGNVSKDHKLAKRKSKTAGLSDFQQESKKRIATRSSSHRSDTDRGKVERSREAEGLALECEPVQNDEALLPKGMNPEAVKKTIMPCKLDMKLKVSLRKGLKVHKSNMIFSKLKAAQKSKAKKSTVKQAQKSDHKIHVNHKQSVPVRERPRKLLQNKTVKCEYCEVDFKNQQEYYDHRRAEESTHKCGICGKVEPYEAHLIVHMQKHRRLKVDVLSDSSEKGKPILNSEVPDDSVTSKSSNKKNKKERMKCNICGLLVSSMDSLKIHTMLHTGEYAYRCCVCGENFSSLSSRQHHMDTHISVHRFRCNPCDKRFASRGELAKHQLTHEIKCDLCGEVFPNKTSRTCHFRVSHPNDILKCSLCSNMFATENDLKKHLAYHKKGKKEQCPVCGVVVSKLKDHMLLHNQTAQEKMYVCDQCPMRYLRKSNLDRHMRTHTGEKPYACNRCPKRFRSNGMLRKHLLTHTQERPYQCEVCGKRCSLRSNLNIHMRVHNSDRHYSCTLCPQAFNHKNSLQGHMKNKHLRDMNVQSSQMHLPVNSHLQHHSPSPHHLDMVSDLDKMHMDTSEHDMHVGLQVGIPQSAGSDTHQDYSHIHIQAGFPPNIAANLPSNLLMEAERMALVKYEIQPQSGDSQGY